MTDIYSAIPTFLDIENYLIEYYAIVKLMITSLLLTLPFRIIGRNLNLTKQLTSLNSVTIFSFLKNLVQVIASHLVFMLVDITIIYLISKQSYYNINISNLYSIASYIRISAYIITIIKNSFHVNSFLECLFQSLLIMYVEYNQNILLKNFELSVLSYIQQIDVLSLQPYIILNCVSIIIVNYLYQLFVLSLSYLRVNTNQT